MIYTDVLQGSLFYRDNEDSAICSKKQNTEKKPIGHTFNLH